MDNLTIQHDQAIISSWIKCDVCNIVSEEKNHLSTDCNRDSSESLIRKRDGFETLPNTSYSTLLPYQIPQVKDTLQTIFAIYKPRTIVDCTCHIGGDSLNFATLFPKANIVAIDNDLNALKCLCHNIEMSKVEMDGFTVIHSDCVNWIQKVGFPADLYYFDPPWGGPSYSQDESINLYLGGEKIANVVNMVLEKNLTRCILLKAPRNFSYESFSEDIKGELRLFNIKKPEKGNKIAYLLLLITPR